MQHRKTVKCRPHLSLDSLGSCRLVRSEEYCRVWPRRSPFFNYCKLVPRLQILPGFNAVGAAAITQSHGDILGRDFVEKRNNQTID